MERVAICHNIRSRENVGSMFRTSDAFGISKIYLTGFTPLPPHPKISKTALGAEEYVPWEQKPSAAALIKRLRRDGYCILALEQAERSITLPLARMRARNTPMALLVGNEVTGVPLPLLRMCDAVMEIPMRGAFVREARHPKHKKVMGKESLNVAIAYGIAAYELSLYRRNKNS